MSIARNDNDELARTIAFALGESRRRLRLQMERAGFTMAKGWEIAEQVVNRPGGGVRWVLSPIHLHVDPPEGLGESVDVDGDGRVPSTGR